jgi:hypothetical protein
MLEEEVRRAALDAVGEHGDERARDVLLHARVSMSAERASWYKVTLGLDAATLGALYAAPAVKDALAGAIAAALGARESVLLDLALRWDRAPRARTSGYRDAPPADEGEPLGAALVAWLDACGESALARVVERADVVDGDALEVVVRVDAFDREALQGAHSLAMLTSCVRDLVGDDRARPVVRVRAGARR